MVVLHRQKMIFLKSRKVAGTSFEIALSRFAGPEDIITPISPADEIIRKRLGFVGPQNYHWAAEFQSEGPSSTQTKQAKSQTDLKFFNHIPARLARRRLGETVWNSYKKVSIIRDPFESAVSFFCWQRGRQNQSPDIADFEDFVLQNRDLLLANRSIYMDQGECQIDFMIRYEARETDISQLERIVTGLPGLGSTFAQISAKVGFRPEWATVERFFSAAPKAQTFVETACEKVWIPCGFKPASNQRNSKM